MMMLCIRYKAQLAAACADRQAHHALSFICAARGGRAQHAGHSRLRSSQSGAAYDVRSSAVGFYRGSWPFASLASDSQARAPATLH
jgi:hypothetical protein